MPILLKTARLLGKALWVNNLPCLTKTGSRMRLVAAPLLYALKPPMKKCCNKLLPPKITYKASVLDSIGLAIFLSFFLSIAGLIAWGLSAWLVSMAIDGTLGERNWYGRTGTGTILLIYGLYKFLPKFINACSYLVNYRLRITSQCSSCKKEYTLAEYPKSHDPL